MLPMVWVRSRLALLMQNDANSFAPAADANKMVLIKAPFSENENLEPGDLELADFTGSTPILCPVGPQQIGIDPNTQEWVLDIKQPAGGYRWQVADLVGLPQTIYGYALLDNAEANIVCIGTLPTPITLNAAFDYVNLPEVNSRFVLRPMS